MKKPSKFNRQRVSVRGLRQVAGDNNYLWRDAEARRPTDFKNLIFILSDMSRPLTLARVYLLMPQRIFAGPKLSESLDTSLHGRLGLYLFVLIQEKIDVLPGARQKQFLEIQGWFTNDSGREVQLDVVSADQEVVFTLAPGDVEPVTMDRDNGTAVTKSKSGKTLAKCALTPPGRVVLHSRKKFYYYRILKDRIEPVPPSDAKGWHVVMPDRD